MAEPEHPDRPESSTRLTDVLTDVVVFAPIGLAALACERLPELAAEGRQRVEQRVTVARFIGRMVVEQGRRELERRLQAATAPPADPTPPGRAPADPASSVDAPPAPARANARGRASQRPDAPAATDLPIEDYESLAASQVVARLGDLAPAGLAAVETFERAHRNRRTVLGRIEQLRSDA